MACTVMAYIVMVYLVVVYAIMATIYVAYIVMAYIPMAYIVMVMQAHISAQDRSRHNMTAIRFSTIPRQSKLARKTEQA